MNQAVKKRKPRTTKKTIKAIIPVRPEVKPDMEIIKDLVLNGDITNMSSEQRVKYYTNLCQSIGLNPMTQPFKIIIVQGKEILYATKTATDQLRQIHGVSVVSIEQSIDDCVLTTKVMMSDKTGRTDGDIGSVNIGGLKGDGLANMKMKSVTKAKRRATLSICGLGMLDESEVETIPNAEIKPIFIPQIENQEVDIPNITHPINTALDLIWTSQTVKQLTMRGEKEIKDLVDTLCDEDRAEIRKNFSKRMHELMSMKKEAV